MRVCVCVCVCVQEMLRCVWRHLVGVLKGESQTLCYTSSLLHTLGSVTVSSLSVSGWVLSLCQGGFSLCVRVSSLCVRVSRVSSLSVLRLVGWVLSLC